MKTLAEYEAWKSSQQQAGVGAANIVLGSINEPPDQAAESMRLGLDFAKATGRPSPSISMVKQYKPVFQRAVEQARASTVLSSSPRLTSWLLNPENAAVARDDLEGLSWWETGLKAAGNAFARGVQGNLQSANQFMAFSAAQRAGDQSKSFGEILQEERTVRLPDGTTYERPGIVNPGDLWNAAMRLATANIARFGGDQEQAAAFYQQQAGVIAKQIEAIPSSPQGQVGKDAIFGFDPTGDWLADTGTVLQRIAQHPGEVLAFLGETAIESAPSLVASAAVTAATRNPTAGAMFMGSQSAFLEAGKDPSQFFAAKGIDISTPEGALRVISDPALMGEAYQRGMTRGVIVGVFDGLSGGIAGQALAKSPIGNVLLQALTQAVMGGAGEASAQLLTDGKIDIRQVIVEGLVEFVSAPLEMLSMGGNMLARNSAKARQAEQERATFEALSKAAQGSKVRERSPEAFDGWLTQALENGPVENLFIPAQTWVTYFQSQGVDPFEMAASINGVSRDDLEVALQTGGDLKIPTASYATVMAGSSHDGFLIENMKLSPDEMTVTEASEFNARSQDALQEAYDLAETLRRDEEELRAVETQIYDEMVSRLRAAGRATDVATTEAMLYPAFYRTMAERSDMAIEDFLAAHPLPQVRGVAPAGMQLRDADALTRTLNEARNRRAVGADRGKSLLEFISERGGIVDPGGELAARDASVIRRGRGKKTLRLERKGFTAAIGDMLGRGSDRAGYGFDEVARAAIEAGYLADDPLVLAYMQAQRDGTEVPDISRALLDAIDRELRGEPIYATDAVAPDGLDQIEEYLASLGVSLDDEDAVIRAAMAEGERQYGQGPISTETEAFKRWFGDSKVVDAEGKPLVVYHGTPAKNIDQFREGYIGSSNDDGFYGRGFYFTPDRQLAEDYRPDNRGGRGRRGHVSEVYLSIRNPFYWDIGTSADEARTISAAEKIWPGMEVSTTGIPRGRSNAAEWRARLQKAGYDGVIQRYKGSIGEIVAFEPTQIKSVYNRGTFDPTDPRILYQADMQAPGGGARGQITFGDEGAVVTLFRSADLSTFLHESGHFFLEALRQINTDDWATVAEYLGVGPEGVLTVEQHERFATEFEAYALSGKAPSIGLRTTFEKFRAWLLSIYRKARGLNLEVSEPLKAVFDRMLATDAEIAAAQNETTPDVALTADSLGMTAEQFATFQKLRSQARDEATAALLNETMAPIRRAATEAYKAERKQVRAIIEKRLQSMPMFRAVQELRFGRNFDGNETAPVKLDRAAIERNYGAGWLHQLPGSTKDGHGHKNAVFAHEGGLHPDIVAGMYGYETGGQLLDALAKAPPFDEAVEAETERQMREAHNEPLTDGSVQQLALDAVHGDKRGEALAAELKALNEVAGLDRGLSVKEARETARRTLRTLRVRDASAAHRFLAAERKAGQEAMRLTAMVTREGLWMDRARRLVETKARGAVRAGDAAAALRVSTTAANASTARFNEDAAALVEAKRRQLMNHMLYAEARKVATGTEAVVDRMAKLNKPDAKLGKVRNVDFVKAARAVAARFGLAAGDRAFDFAVWMEQLKVDDPVTAADLQYAIDVNTQEARNFKDLTVAEFETTADAIENILAVGKRSRELEIDGQRVERDLAVSELRDVLDQRTPVANKALSRKLTRFEKVRVGTLSVLSSLRRMEAWTRDMDDGGQGAFTRYLTKPVMDALGAYRNDRANRLGQLLAIVEPRRADLLGAAVAAPELGYTFQNKGELLHAILHTGNESNLEKLLLGRGWSKGLAGQVQKVTKGGKLSVGRQGNPLMTRGRVDTSQWDAFVARLISEGVLVKEDFDTAQAIWDLMDEIKRPAQSAHRRVYGFYFNEVEASPVVTPFGTYRGGYVPAIADTDASNDGQIRQDQQALEAQQTSFMFPTTGSGFTKSRVENYTTPLSLNLMLLPAHMDKVLRFTHLNPVIRQTASLVTKGELRGAIDAVDPSIIPNLITPWLQRTAQQAVEQQPTTPAGRAASVVWREMRKRVGLSTMFLNVVNTLQQVTGLSSALVLVKPGRMVTAMTRFARDAGGMRTEAMEASAFMRDRIANASRELQGRVQDAIVKPTALGELQGLANKHGYFLQQGAQNLVDVIAWHAAYDQAIAGGMDGDAAVFEADSVIRRAMGDFSPENLSMFETGPAFARLFTMFYSYFNGQANLVGGEMATAMRQTGWAGKKRMFFIYLYGMAIPAIVGEAISQAARGDLGDEDDDGWLDDLGELFFGAQARYLSGMLPVVGPMTTGMLNSFNDKFYDDRISVSPVAQGAETLVRVARSVSGAVQGDNVDKGVKDGITALGLVLGIPLGQLGKMSGYGANVAEGDAQPENPLDVVEGLLTGRDGTE